MLHSHSPAPLHTSYSSTNRCNTLANLSSVHYTSVLLSSVLFYKTHTHTHKDKTRTFSAHTLALPSSIAQIVPRHCSFSSNKMSVCVLRAKRILLLHLILSLSRYTRLSVHKYWSLHMPSLCASTEEVYLTVSLSHSYIAEKPTHIETATSFANDVSHSVSTAEKISNNIRMEDIPQKSVLQLRTIVFRSQKQKEASASQEKRIELYYPDSSFVNLRVFAACKFLNKRSIRTFLIRLHPLYMFFWNLFSYLSHLLQFPSLLQTISLQK